MRTGKLNLSKGDGMQAIFEQVIRVVHVVTIVGMFGVCVLAAWFVVTEYSYARRREAIRVAPMDGTTIGPGQSITMEGIVPGNITVTSDNVIHVDSTCVLKLANSETELD